MNHDLFFKKNYVFLSLFLAVLGLYCCLGAVVTSGGYSLGVVCRPLIAVASLVAEHRL